MSAKLATLGLLKIKVFLEKGYGVNFFAHDVTNKRVKTKSQKFWGANFYVYRSYREKTGTGVAFCPPSTSPPFLNRIKYETKRETINKSSTFINDMNTLRRKYKNLTANHLC